MILFREMVKASSEIISLALMKNFSKGIGLFNEEEKTKHGSPPAFVIDDNGVATFKTASLMYYKGKWVKLSEDIYKWKPTDIDHIQTEYNENECTRLILKCKSGDCIIRNNWLRNVGDKKYHQNEMSIYIYSEFEYEVKDAMDDIQASLKIIEEGN